MPSSIGSALEMFAQVCEGSVFGGKAAEPWMLGSNLNLYPKSKWIDGYWVEGSKHRYIGEED